MTATTGPAGDEGGWRNDAIANVAWSAAAALLCWLLLLHLGVMASFTIGLRASPALAPLATVAALLVAWRIGRCLGLGSGRALVPPVVVALVIAVGLALAAVFYDFTWDGQWYHQTAVYKMSAGWNPLWEPVPEEFGTRFWRLWVVHYAKGPWYWALTLYATTGSIEMAKAASAIVPLIAFLVVLAVAIDFGIGRGWAAVVALVTTLNPVTTCGLVTHQVDGILVSLLACAVAGGMAWMRRPSWLSAFVAFTAGALCMNVKFTGVVYVCFFYAAGIVYCLWKRRDLVGRYSAFVAASLVAGVLLIGYNPYVTNTVHRGHPFYPMQGSAEHPSLADQGRDPIEQYETPENMKGRNRFLRLGYGIFGRPGTAPFVTKTAELMWPFGATWRDFARYYFHDVRIGGFGPWFSGPLLLALLIAIVGCARRTLPAGALLLVSGAIVLSLLVSTHTWWARYGPHLWWLPIVPMAAALRLQGWPKLKRDATAVLLLLLVNTLIVSAVHMRWEWRSTQALTRQLSDLRGAGPLTVDLAYFDVPVAERFKTEGIAFDARSLQFRDAPKYECPRERQLELMTVCHGYPDWIRLCLADEARASQLRAQPHWQWSAQP
jgi:hypothetical protein